ncbi:MAG TPA: helix-turn-helix domain-containing protein [Streptosporangiaceae bacterium]|nr:helix-turn-helix domain-containing protein [Streptosporangiaceae bacterium]
MSSADRWTVERGLRDSGLAPSARLVALSLLTRAEAGTAKIPLEFAPSLSMLASDTGLSRTGVRNALNKLESEGWLTRNRNLARSWAERLPTGYKLHLPSRALSGLGHSVPYSSRANSRALSRALSAPRPELPELPEQTTFTEFWKIYPRQIDEQAAARAWAAALRDAAADGADPAAVIIDACRRFARRIDGTEPEFICKPAKWLQECRWRDDLVDAVKVDLPRKDH